MALAVVLPTFGQQNTVNAAIDATELLVGEQTVLHTTVNCNAGARVKFEGKKGENLTPGVEIVEISRPDTLLLNNGKRWQITRNYTHRSTVHFIVCPPSKSKLTVKRYSRVDKLH